MSLNDTQLLLLSRATQRDDLLVTVPETMQERTYQSAIARLLRLGLIEEVHAADPPWSVPDGEEPRPCLRITLAGLQVLGLDTDEPTPSCDPVTPQPAPSASSRSTKRERVLAMLHQPQGVSLQELVSATGWLPHTARAALSGLRKAGHAITRAAKEDGTSSYRISPVNEREVTAAADGEQR